MVHQKIQLKMEGSVTGKDEEITSLTENYWDNFFKMNKMRHMQTLYASKQNSTSYPPQTLQAIHYRGPNR